MKNILIACEESQAIANEFRALGFNAYSADLQECSGGHPEYHIKGDCLPLLNGNCTFTTEDGQTHSIEGRWDLIVAHPPCTYLTVAGAWLYNVERFGDKAIKRMADRKEAEEFFLKFTTCDCDHVAIENPVGTMSTTYRKADQVIQPWHYGDPFMKSTCLWLKGLPLLQQTHFEKPKVEYKEWVDKNGKHKRQDLASYKGSFLRGADRQRLRSKTFPGIAKAIASQWKDVI